MYEYELTVSKTSGIRVRAKSREEAFATVNNMSNREIEATICATDWECTNAEGIKQVEFYYQITLPKTRQVFFRDFCDVQEPESIISLALDKGLVSEASSCSHALQLEREVYQSKIVDYLYTKMCREREEFRQWMESRPPEYIYNHCGDIQFYEDIIWLFEDFAEDEDFDLTAVEKLVTAAKPIEILSSSYVNIDFSSMNNQLMELINHTVER